MWLTEYNEDEIKEAMRLDGIAQGRAEDVSMIMSNLGLTLEDACSALNITVEEYNSAKALVANK